MHPILIFKKFPYACVISTSYYVS